MDWILGVFIYSVYLRLKIKARGKIKPYKEQDSPKQTAQEPMMATYHQSAIPMDDFINSIPRDALAEALLFALEENKAGHCISNSQIESMINERMGWK